MKKKSALKPAFFNPRVLIGFVLFIAAVLLALVGFGMYHVPSALAQGQSSSKMMVVTESYHDTSPPLRDMLPGPVQSQPEQEPNENPPIPNAHVDGADPVVQDSFNSLLGVMAPNIPNPILNLYGIDIQNSYCACAPPDTNGAVGKTQYVQIVNTAYEVFDKSTGASVLGPNRISSIWTGSTDPICTNNGRGDPVVVYDHLADRWVISQFAFNANGSLTHECVAVSTTSDATGSYNRYDFDLQPGCGLPGNPACNFFDYPKVSVWPDAYYMSMNIFQGSYIGPQPFAFDRSKMLAGLPASLVSTAGPLLGLPGTTVPSFLPADLDGATLPPVGAPNPFVGFPGQAAPQYTIYRFHVDFATPANSTFIADTISPVAAPFVQLCRGLGRSCVPQQGTTTGLDGLGDRLMFRLTYRNFGDHESLVGNYTVGPVAGVRWFELRNVSSGMVTVFQESTYQPPDATWRWMGSAAMDKRGNLAVGFSASDPTINPQIRYAGRLESDLTNQLSQGEAHLFDGTGSQIDTVSRWGDYSAMSVDPVDDSTFWYTNEYYDATSSFNWRTRIGNFRIPSPHLVSVVSRKTHGSAGTFDIDLPLSGTRGVECRSGGATGDYTMIFTFPNNVTAVANASVTCGSVSSSAVGPNSKQYTVNLTGENVCNGRYVTVRLTGVVDSSGATFDTAQTMGLLFGDVDANGVVDGNDVSATQSQSGIAVGASNFREDVTVNGLINSSDTSFVQSKTRTALPSPP